MDVSNQLFLKKDTKVVVDKGSQMVDIAEISEHGDHAVNSRINLKTFLSILETDVNLSANNSVSEVQSGAGKRLI